MMIKFLLIVGTMLPSSMNTNRGMSLHADNAGPRMTKTVDKAHTTTPKAGSKRTRADVRGKKFGKGQGSETLSEEEKYLLAMKRYKIETPDYDLTRDLPDDIQVVDVPAFVSPDRDPLLIAPAKSLHDVNGMKVSHKHFTVK